MRTKGKEEEGGWMEGGKMKYRSIESRGYVPDIDKPGISII